MDKFKELMAKKEDMENKLRELKEEFDVCAKEHFTEWAKDLFERYPPLNLISWTGYTPSWNDGDPTFFLSSHTYYSINSTESEETDDEGFGEKQLENLKEEVDKFISQFDDDDMERLFGNGVRVLVTKGGVEVEEYYD